MAKMKNECTISVIIADSGFQVQNASRELARSGTQAQSRSTGAPMTTESRSITVTLQLSDEEAWALAQFAKRVGWSEVRCNAKGDGEGQLIRSGVEQVAAALRHAGYASR